MFERNEGGSLMGNTVKSKALIRIESLLDASSFVEIGAAVTARNTDFHLSQIDTPSDGVITGYGLMNGYLVYVYSQDVSVLGGSIGEMHAKKIVNLYDMAIKMGAPVIGLLDCAGIRLQEATDALHAFGKIYQRQAKASGVVPQITAIFGTCGGGLAVVPALTDFAFMEKQAKLFVNAPNALCGNRKEQCDTADVQFQSEETGMIDMIGEEGEIFSGIRQLLSMLPSNYEDEGKEIPCKDDLNRICQVSGNMSQLLTQIADRNFFMELKAMYGTDMIIGFLRLNGNTVGCIANGQQRISSHGAEKTARFIRFCDAFEIPILTLTDTEGFVAEKEEEKEIAKAVASMTRAFAEATVAKVSVITGKAFGSAYVAMNSKSLGADMVYAWPQAEIGMMQADMAAKIMYPGESAEVLKEKAQEYEELQSSVDSAARRGYVDTIIQPEDTRKYVIGAFEMLYTKKENGPAKKHSAF